MDWNFIMNTALATVIASLVALAGVFVTHWFDFKNGYKKLDSKIGNLENKTLVGLIEEKTGRLDNTTLSGQHAHIEDFISQKIGDSSNTTLSGQNTALLNEIQKMQDKMDSDKKLELLKRQQLTGEQSQIEQCITTLSAFSKLMVDMQAQDTALKMESQNLKKENTLLRGQVQDFRQDQSESMEESEVDENNPEMENTMHFT